MGFLCRFFRVAVLFTGMSGSVMAAEKTLQHWDYREKNFPDPWNGISMIADVKNLTPERQTALRVTCEYDRDDLEWPSFLAYRIDSKLLAEVKKVELSFYVKGKKGDVIGLRVTAHAPNSTHFSKTVEYTLTGEWQRISYREPLFGPPGSRFADAPRLLLLKFLAGDRFYFGPLTLKSID